MSDSPLALVTGASGFVGGSLARRLLDDGYTVRLLLRRPEAAPHVLRERCEIFHGDLNNASVMRQAVKGCDYVFHCAANANTWDTQDNYEAANLRGVHSLLMALSRNNLSLKRLVHLSTVDVYGYPDAACDEQSATRKTGYGYGDSKLDGETLLRSYGDAHNIPYVILRPTNIIGPGSQFIEQIDDALRNRSMLTIDRGSANAGLVYIDNLIDYILWSATSDTALNNIYNVRDDYDVNWQEFITRLQQLTGDKSNVRNLPYRAAKLTASVLEALYRVGGRTSEPPLHRLLVDMFGKTCGHPGDKIRSASGIHSAIAFDEAMALSVVALQAGQSKAA